MNRKKLWWVIGMLGLVLLLAWAPWLSRAGAESIAAERFAAAWAGVADGCGINCQGCGASDAQRMAFGFTVQLEYACGLIPADLPEYHRVSTGFVSFLGTAHGYPGP